MYFFLIFIPIIVTIFFLIYYYSSKEVLIRKFKQIPNSSVNNLRTNQLTKITGKASPIKDPLIAPFSKRKCVFYRIKIEERKKRGETNRWVTIINDEKIQPFYLVKNGEQVIIEPSQELKNYKAHLVIDERTSSGTFNDASPEFESLLNRYNIKSTGFFGFNKSLRYSEAIVAVGEEITVAGIGKWKDMQEPIEGYAYSKIAALESAEKQKLLITDLPKEKLNTRR